MCECATEDVIDNFDWHCSCGEKLIIERYTRYKIVFKPCKCQSE